MATFPRMACAVCKENILITCHSSHPASDDEWEAYCTIIENLTRTSPSTMRIIVFTDGGGPNVHQRHRAVEAAGAGSFPVAVISGSSLVRGIVTALSWMSSVRIKSFKPAEIERALSHLGVKPIELADVKTNTRQLSDQLGGLKTAKQWLDTNDHLRA